MPKLKTLTERQIRFAHEYMVDTNAKHAAIRAGYAQSGATVTAARLLAMPDVQAILEGFREALVESTEIRADRTVEALKAIAFANISDYFQIIDGVMEWKQPADLTTEQLIAVKRIHTRVNGDVRHIEFHDKLVALEKLCQLSMGFADANRCGPTTSETDTKFLEMISHHPAKSLNLSCDSVKPSDSN